MEKNDPVLELADWRKKVNYLGHELIVADWIKWIATDEDGWAWGYKSRPFLIRNTWDLAHGATRLAFYSLKGLDWRETLREV